MAEKLLLLVDKESGKEFLMFPSHCLKCPGTTEASKHCPVDQRTWATLKPEQIERLKCSDTERISNKAGGQYVSSVGQFNAPRESNVVKGDGRIGRSSSGLGRARRVDSDKS